MAHRTVLVINSGSSSIKYQLIDPDTAESLANGLVERIGEDKGTIAHTYGGEKNTFSERIADHGAGLRRVIEICDEIGPDLASSGVVAVGHRVVQGGAYFATATAVDDDVLERITELIPLAPLHNPANVKGIEVARELLPDVPHVAVFDTAFFRGLPKAAATYALDREIARKLSIRRYGFHGTSHQYVSQAVAEMLGRTDLKQIVLHLGNGASASAVVGGHAIDTSMGLTPLEGLVMGTRSGDLDPAVVFHLRRVGGYDLDKIDDLLNKRSGLKGLCGNNDMREVHAMADSGDPEAQLALDVYAHRLRKYIGAYAAVMGGLDALTFTAGVGENDSQVRASACEGLGFLGVHLDAERNETRSKEARLISTDDSPVKVFVVPTNEELAIARQCVHLLEA
ncbi:MAG: acetate kinase [Actinomycetales bacterium]|nr:acetate kinase [Actinomycetales bacterium]